MIVLKFGGTSVANAQHIKKVRDIVALTESDKLIVVVSAMGGITDLLLRMATKASRQNPGYKEDLKEIENRHQNVNS